ncbi:methionine--tRNA ligase [Parvicella tangerina]|uniref:Methionine--tRNA ligase n=1 Tax=Parvicella tangerina TaxID=2829795 RepID=A0A916JQP2_9FLAO|nr:methionine--tRNA ligase [Parvicella tangerina]CAG5087232.1 Methionine--tRNA ligase [Parvicella tangerina]
MNQPKRYTITAALPYANGPLHLGHLAGVYIPADIYSRYLKSNGKDALFVCGSDEHGAAITIRAKQEGTTPQDIVDRYHTMISSTFERLGVNFDIYHRTSSDLHKETASGYFSQLEGEGKFLKKTTEQYYDAEFKQFLADRYITGTCPKCKNEGAYGDQCEKCGSDLSPLDLINPKSTLSGKTPELKETSHWYLPMDEHEAWVKDWIENGVLDGKQHHYPKEWRNQVIGQCLSWIEGGLKPRAMTRDLDWGVKVPVDGGEGKVLYVWFDAPIGYISATKQWAEDNGKNWEDYWKAEDTHLIHFLAKDNIVFHTIIFPIMLKLFGDHILPYNVPANEFLNLEGQKLSTSKNWAVWGHEYLDDFPGQEDVLRYVLCSIAPESKDSDFSWKDFQTRNNSELADIFGNFVNRTLVLTHKYYEGKVPAIGGLEEIDRGVINELEAIPEKIGKAIEAFRFREAQSEAMNLARLGNKYLADTEPWKLIKTHPDRVKTIINISLQITANLAIVFEPFLPFTSKKLFSFLNIDPLKWSSAGMNNLMKTNHEINKPEILFSKIEDQKIEEQLDKLKQPSNNFPPMKDEIAFDDFMKMDIRVGEIKTAEKVKKADKLLKLTVDTGLDVRTVVSGIAEHYSPEEVVGKRVSILMNLAPRKIRGVESQGMILMAEDQDGNLSFVSPTKDMGPGGEIR